MPPVKCIACGSDLESRDVQMRSADEAHTTITSCPNCPVDANKLSSTKMPVPPLRGMNRRIRRSLPVVPKKFDNIRSLYAITADIPSSHPLMQIELDSRHLIQYSQFYNKRASDATINIVLSAYSVVNGIFKDKCINFRNARNIGMGITIDTYNVLAESENIDGQVIIKGTYTHYNKIYNCNSYIYSNYNEQNRKLIVELTNETPSDYIIRNIVNTIYLDGILPDNINKYISADTIATFSNLSPRGWDASAPPETGHKFTCKPDGQNTWLIWIGHIWYKFNPRCKGGIKSWTWTSTSNDNNAIVINVEDMASYGYIIIDCFTDENGNIADSSRDINWVINTIKNIMKNNREFPISIREYFDNYDHAVSYCDRVLYPTDGIVAIRDGSTEILKIKPIRSVELMLAENYTLVTSESTPVLKCPDYILLTHKVGSILEIRFEMPKSNIIKVLDVFERTDKDNANSNNAVSNIIRSACKLLTADDNERRIALLWCNNLRKDLYLLASNHKSNKNIIIDIGTGTGQSLDSLVQSESISYVFIEPDIDRCKSIARRLGIRKIISNPTDMIPMMKSLKTRSVKYAVINCYIADILKHDRLSHVLFNEAKSITCTFSMQFIIEALHYIRWTYNIPIYGCGYVYDDINDNGTLIDQCGVLMKIECDNKAVIKWGNDKEYTEPITRKRDYAGIGTVIPGSEIVQLPDKIICNKAYNICRHVIAVVP